MSATPLSRFLVDLPSRGRATEVVTDALREAIITGHLPPGTWLREDEIARELSVSRTPVREALRRLADDGLAEKHAHQGTIVAGVSFEDVLALYAVREPLEGTVARFAAARRTDELVAALREAQADMAEAAAQHDPDGMVEFNRQFHRILSDATGNVYLRRFMLQIENAIRRLPSTTYSSPKRQQTVLSEHEAIIAAVDAGDPDLAAVAASLHMRNAREVRLTLL
ncbi:GntR family transcriptional regulator [Intrasporangium calvum]|nr:GntR family transcriptional regulator [Intrasporangium calvum]